MSQIAAQAPPDHPMPAWIVRIRELAFVQTKSWMVILIFLLMLGLLGWLDVLSGPKVHLGFLYIFPVILAAWFGARFPGYVLCLGAIVVWYHVSRPRADGDGFLINFTNVLIHLIYYGVLVEIVNSLRDFGQRLERSVQQRTAELRQEITERQRAEESLRKLAGQLSEAEDVERRRIAYDIHDALSQMLGVAKINLETVVAETATDSRQFDRLSDVVKVIGDLIAQTREMTFDLHPSMLDHFGLVPTLQQFAEDFQRRTLAEVSVSESGDRSVLPVTMASYLFRAIKELVNNSVKHGNAREIYVALWWEKKHLRCVVDDDGRGFDPAKALAPQARRGLGLAGIDERLTSLGGKLSVESEIGNGARIILEVPLPSDISQEIGQ
jgi:signal transduction histidine kinase